MKIATISLIYLLMIVPLISSALCYVANKRSLGFWNCVTTQIIALLIIFLVSKNVIINEKIFSDFEISPLSLALEFQLDLLSLPFLFVVNFLKFAILIFYRFDIEKLVDKKLRNKVYGLMMLDLFAINGIILANNLFNLFIFIEIYGFTVLAISSLTNDKKILKNSFNFFCLNSASSLLLLISFVVIYLCFLELNLSKIVDNFTLISPSTIPYLFIILFIISLSFIIKFFSFFGNFIILKLNNKISDLILLDAFFIRVLIGVFLTLKFVHFFFGNQFLFIKFDYDIFLVAFSLILITYSVIKIINEKHLKTIVVYLCINNLGFIIGGLAVQNVQSIVAVFYFILNFAIINFTLFLLATFIKRKYYTSSLLQINLGDKISKITRTAFVVIVVSLLSLPLTLNFFGNFYLAQSVLNLDIFLVIILAMLLTNFANFKIAIDIVKSIFKPQTNTHNYQAKTSKVFFNLAILTMVIIFALSLVFVDFINSFAFNFASYLLVNAI